eukprot:9019549-Pyramimonas_sp.AAC.1
MLRGADLLQSCVGSDGCPFLIFRNVRGHVLIIACPILRIPKRQRGHRGNNARGSKRVKRRSTGRKTRKLMPPTPPLPHCKEGVGTVARRNITEEEEDGGGE